MSNPIFIVVALMLLASMGTRGFAGICPMHAKLANAFFASLLTLGHYVAMGRFWWLAKEPHDAMSALFQPAGYFPGWLVFSIHIIWVSAGVVAVFVGFAVANWRSSGRKWAVKLCPFLFIANLGQFMLAVQQREALLSAYIYLIAIFSGTAIFAALFGVMYKFYSNENYASCYNGIDTRTH